MAEQPLLVVNADDFGLAAGTNRGVAQAFDRGIVRSASLLAGGAAFAEAVAIAKSRAALGVGVHLALTQVRPVLPPERLPGLCAGGDSFADGPGKLIARLAAGRIPRAEIVAEWSAQIERALATGLTVTHLDGHQHLHVLPALRDIFAELAGRYGIGKVRLPGLSGPSRSPGEWLKAAGIATAARLARPAFAGLSWPDRFWGLACSGDLHRENLLAILRSITAGSHELMTHPADFDPAMRQGLVWDYHWETELAALCDPAVVELVWASGLRLGNYRDLA